MKRSTKLNQQLTALRAEGNKILDAMEAAGDNAELFAAEKAKLDANKAKIAQLSSLRDEAVVLEEAERNSPAIDSDPDPDPVPEGRTSRVTGVRNRADADSRRGFSTPREFLSLVRDNAAMASKDDVDEKLRSLTVASGKRGEPMEFLLPVAFSPTRPLATAGSDEQGGYADRFGGFAVATTVAPGVLSVGAEADPTAGRTRQVPMQTAIVDMLAMTDKDHTSSVSGGFTVSRRPETVALSASRASMEKVTLRAAMLGGLAFTTDEIMRDSPLSFLSIVGDGMRRQFGATILNEKIRGPGGDAYLGVLNSPCLVTVLKESGQPADTINAKNVINMAARGWGLDNAVWLANHDTRPQIATLSIAIGTAGVLLYQPSQTPGFPDMLWGRPIYYTEFASKLGDVGDLILGDWSQYLEGTYQALETGESIHVRFDRFETAFRFSVRNAGAPWWRVPLTPNQSAVTLSPFVVLEAR